MMDFTEHGIINGYLVVGAMAGNVDAENMENAIQEIEGFTASNGAFNPFVKTWINPEEIAMFSVSAEDPEHSFIRLRDGLTIESNCNAETISSLIIQLTT